MNNVNQGLGCIEITRSSVGLCVCVCVYVCVCVCVCVFNFVLTSR